MVICRRNVRDGLYNGLLIVAYMDGGKAPALFLVVSLLTVLFLTGRYLSTHCFMADSISFVIETLGKGVTKEQQNEAYCFVGRGNRIGQMQDITIPNDTKKATKLGMKVFSVLTHNLLTCPVSSVLIAKHR